MAYGMINPQRRASASSAKNAGSDYMDYWAVGGPGRQRQALQQAAQQQQAAIAAERATAAGQQQEQLGDIRGMGRQGMLDIQEQYGMSAARERSSAISSGLGGTSLMGQIGGRRARGVTGAQGRLQDILARLRLGVRQYGQAPGSQLVGAQLGAVQSQTPTVGQVMRY